MVATPGSHLGCQEKGQNVELLFGPASGADWFVLCTSQELTCFYFSINNLGTSLTSLNLISPLL